MKRNSLYLQLILVLSMGAVTLNCGASDKPNVIIILADDLGYADLGVYGCKDVPTPHIDQIAKKGVKFTSGYATHPVCAPSRAGLMSGMYQHRFGFENNSGPERTAPPNFGFPRDVPTLAERLKPAGYATGLIGKWHLGFKDWQHPNERGFDHFYGFIGGSRSFYPDKSKQKAPLMRNGTVVDDETEYLTDAFAREAVSFIERASAAGAADTTATTNGETPYFLFLSFSAVHLPLEVPESYIARFPDITDPKRKIYAGMLSAMDDAVGRVMAKVRELGQERNTLVFFYSDNGGPTPHTTSSNNPLRGVKGDVYEGGIRVPFLMQWPARVPAGKTYAMPVMGFDCHATAMAAAQLEIDSPDAKNLVPYVDGDMTSSPHTFLAWRFAGRKALRMDNYKLVQPGPDAKVELYDLATDIGEQNNIAAENAAVTQKLSAKFEEWEKQMKPAAWTNKPEP